MSSIFIGYGSRYGTTEDIVKFLKYRFELHGHHVTIQWLDEKGSFYRIKPHQFDLVLIGSGIKNNRWTRGSLRFINNHKHYINQDPFKFALFVCTQKLADPKQYYRVFNMYIEQFCKNNHILEPFSAVFPGVYDFSKDTNYSLIYRIFLKLQLIISGRRKLGIDFSAYNDFRDWERIDQFAQNILSSTDELVHMV